MYILWDRETSYNWTSCCPELEKSEYVYTHDNTASYILWNIFTDLQPKKNVNN